VDLDHLAEAEIASSGATSIPKVDVQALARVSSLSSVLNMSAFTNAPSSMAKRVVSELTKVASGRPGIWLHTGEGVHLFPSESDLTFWRALIEGPIGTPFEGGVFVLTVRLPLDYPFHPPNIRFETPVYHANTSDAGAICLDILDQAWAPSLSVPKAIEAVRLLLGKPDTNNALRQWIAELTQAHWQHGEGDTRYVDEARAHTRKHASRSVAEWKAEWGCVDC